MEIDHNDVPREFSVGMNNEIIIKDCATIFLNPNEQVTFVTQDKKEYDICCKEWGFYATPSINGRLLKFGFHTVLVENLNNFRYIWLVEHGKEALFEAYLESENHRIIQWLSRVGHEEPCICGLSDFKLVYHYSNPPLGETSYDLRNQEYCRDLVECMHCGHILLLHQYNLASLYSGQYAQTTYQHKLSEIFYKIINLPESNSDNFGRVDAVIRFCKSYFGEKKVSVLDVGSGLCVFLYLLSLKTNWTLFALDPDPIQAQHAEVVCHIQSICSHFESFQPNKKFDLITFNKVLEHVKNPVQMLALAKNHLSKNGLVYIELPDGTEALKDSVMREEFFIEHFHAFSMASTALLVEKAGFTPLFIERLQEPSGKYTLRVFCQN